MSDLNAIDQALKDIVTDSRWRHVSKIHRYAEIDGIRVGAAFATNSKSQYATFALNRADLERLRNAKGAGKLDQAFVVAMKTNSAGQIEYCGYAEAETLHENLLHRSPINGTFGPFWSLNPDEFEREDVPF